jgi:uncharacterized SAM-binding protein YcdF (DUF218 family)
MTYVQPLTLLCLVILAIGLIQQRRTKRSLLPTVGLFTLFVLTWPPIDWLMSLPLEARYPVQPFPSGTVQAIVVLSSSVDPPRHERPYPVPDKDGYRRCEHAAWLYKHWLSVPVLASGGSQSVGTQPLSTTMRELLNRAGVPDSEILTEDRSRSTHENAVYSAEILRKRGITNIALVVEAFAMPRAAAAFRHEGMNVVPAPSSFRDLGPVRDELIPSWKAVERNEGTLHEVLGLAWYQLRGWI